MHDVGRVDHAGGWCFVNARIWLFGLLLAVSPACGQRPMMPDEIPADGRSLLASVEERSELVRTARIRATLEYFGRGERLRIRQALVVDAAGRLRMETISPMDTTLSVFVVDGPLMHWYDIASEVFYTGESTAAHIGQLIPLRLAGADLVALLTAGIPLPAVDDATSWPVTWNRRSGTWLVQAPESGGGFFELSVDPVRLVVERIEFSGNATLDAWELRLGDYRPATSDAAGTPEVLVPYRLRFRMRSERVDISLELERYQLNPELPDVLFELEPPRGVPVRQLGGSP
jgi:outer membrane lipoprotein-sorting protein